MRFPLLTHNIHSLTKKFNFLFLCRSSSQIFDASTNTWKIVNERSHTDFVEKIVETPRETIIIDDITDITKIKSINDRIERTTDITDVTDINRVKNTINLHETEENILREVTKENVVVSLNLINSH